MPVFDKSAFKNTIENKSQNKLVVSNSFDQKSIIGQLT